VCRAVVQLVQDDHHGVPGEERPDAEGCGPGQVVEAGPPPAMVDEGHPHAHRRNHAEQHESRRGDPGVGRGEVPGLERDGGVERDEAQDGLRNREDPHVPGHCLLG
jgi:hypothetical protein